MEKRNISGFNILFLLIFTNICSQNLVPDGSFEKYTQCPQGIVLEQLSTLKYWKQFDKGTPDYFNLCGSKSVTIPQNFAGYQIPYHGDGYAGVISYSNLKRKYREKIYTKIKTELLKDSLYFVCYFVNLSNFNLLASNNVNAYFLDKKTNLVSVSVKFDTIIQDTLNWIKLIGCFKANGGENTIVLGNMEKASNVKKKKMKRGFPFTSYYFIDDVKLYALSEKLLNRSRDNEIVILTEIQKVRFNDNFNSGKIIEKKLIFTNELFFGILKWLTKNVWMELKIEYSMNNTTFDKKQLSKLLKKYGISEDRISVTQNHDLEVDEFIFDCKNILTEQELNSTLNQYRK